MKISATIITLNEERNLARALESLHCVDEVVVVDSGSTDRTCEIARGRGACVIAHAWQGYAAQKNFAAAHAGHSWILSLDADEALSEELQAEIAQLRLHGMKRDAYSMPRLAQYLGRWILHSGWYPDRKVRLYERSHAEWVGDPVHESVRVHGTVGELQGKLLHFTCDSLSQHLQTLDRYTTLAARNARPRGLAWLLFSPAWTFVRSYVVQRGFQDGPQGFAIAWMAALYTFLKYAKARRDLGR